MTSKKQGKKYVQLKWKKVSGASGYIIYGNKCGKKNKIRKIAEVKKTSYKHKGLKKGTYYKYVVIAVKNTSLGQRTAAVSKMIHVCTTGGKTGNTRSISIKKTLIRKAKKLKKGKSLKLKAALKNGSKKVKKHCSIRYESSNKAIAAVSKKGVIKAKKKGSCQIYVYAQNGAMKKIKVTVR